MWCLMKVPGKRQGAKISYSIECASATRLRASFIILFMGTRYFLHRMGIVMISTAALL